MANEPTPVLAAKAVGTALVHTADGTLLRNESGELVAELDQSGEPLAARSTNKKDTKK